MMLRTSVTLITAFCNVFLRNWLLVISLICRERSNMLLYIQSSNLFMFPKLLKFKYCAVARVCSFLNVHSNLKMSGCHSCSLYWLRLRVQLTIYLPLVWMPSRRSKKFTNSFRILQLEIKSQIIKKGKRFVWYSGVSWILQLPPQELFKV